MTLMERRRALMFGKDSEDENMISFRSTNINGTLRTKTVTITSNSVANASQIWAYIDSFLDSGEKCLMFASTTFSLRENGIKYGLRAGIGALFSSSVSVTFCRYRNGDSSEFYGDSGGYDARLTAGDTYLLLYESAFTKSATE